jgi:hypothetical protein
MRSQPRSLQRIHTRERALVATEHIPLVSEYYHRKEGRRQEEINKYLDKRRKT